jgi:hypothetical protein
VFEFSWKCQKIFNFSTNILKDIDSLPHLKNWSKRLDVGCPENLAITKLAEKHKLFRDLNLTHNHARSAYRLTPAGTSVWNSHNEIAVIDKSASLAILA